MRVRRSLTAAFLPLLVFAFAPRSVAADDAKRQMRAFEQALASHDCVQWDRSLSALSRMDHPAAVLMLARFYVEQERYEGEWTSLHTRSAARVRSADPLRAYAARLSSHGNVRSLRVMVDALDDEDGIEVELFTEALRGNPALHLVDDPLRQGLQVSLRKGKDEIARRYLALLWGRLHAGDVAWVEALVANPRVDEVLRLELLETFPFHDLWRRLLAHADEDPVLDTAAFVAVIAEQLELPLSSARAARSALERVRSDADQVEQVLAENEKLDEAIGGVSRPRARAALHELVQREWKALFEEPAMEALASLHASFVTIRYARSFRRDRYFFQKEQRQRFDKRIDDAKIVQRSGSIDLTRPPLAGRVTKLAVLEERLDALASDVPTVRVGAPYHRELLALNRHGACDVESIAFTPAERAWRTRRDEVLAYNAAARGPTPAERENVALVNAYRLQYDLLPLRIDADLTVSARKHSAFQRSMGQIAHEFPAGREPEGRTAVQRMVRAGYPLRYAGGENVLVGSSDPARAFRWWQGSPGHRANMLSPAWTEIGAGRSGKYWTQNFGREPYDQDDDE